MSYTKQIFTSGQILKASDLNTMSQGITSKQDTLVSGTTLKTINGKSLLGSGDISIEGGSGGSSVAQAINYDLNVKAINHRGYSSESPENTIPAYIMSKQKGFTYVECDVSFTSDGVAVLLHDATIDRTSNGSGSISNMTYAKALSYDFGSWFSDEFAGVKIPTFTEFIMTCKGLGLHPYIELKSNGSYTQAQITQIVDEVESCGMKGKVTYISFSNKFLGYVKNADPDARLGYLLSTVNSTGFNNATALRSGTNEVFIDAKLANLTTSIVQSCVDKGFPLEVWTVNTEAEIKSMPDYVTGVTSDYLVAGKVLYEKYATYTPPEGEYIPATGITLDKTSIVFADLEAQTIKATVTPSNASDKVVWKSSDASVAVVDGGVVTPVKKGSCTITATCGDVSATCSVEVSYEIIVYSITRNLTSCNSTSSVVSVVEGASHSETLSPVNGYEFTSGSVTVTMGGNDISSYFVDGVLTIPSVTGDVEITAVATMVAPVVDLDFTSVDGDVLVNNGSGGATYNATLSTVNATDSYNADENGVSLTGHAYASVPYGFSASKPFTIVVKGSCDEFNENKYHRLFRTDSDAPSAYHILETNAYGFKLAGVTDNGLTAVSSKAVYSKGYNSIFAEFDTIGSGVQNTFVFVNDGTLITMYLNGEKFATQKASKLTASTSIGIGDNDPAKTYYADKITVSKLKVFDYPVNEADIATL